MLDFKEKLDKEKGEERTKSKTGRTLTGIWMAKSGADQRRAGRVWRGQAPPRPILSEESTIEDLEDKLGWIQSTLTGILDEHVRVITICARPNRWWNGDIKEKRRKLGRAIRGERRDLETFSQEEAKEAKRALKWQFARQDVSAGRSF